MGTSSKQRVQHICLIGIAALLPFAFISRGYPGEYRDAGILSLISLFFVMLYIRSQRQTAQRNDPDGPKNP